jgi:hypothetical protein
LITNPAAREYFLQHLGGKCERAFSKLLTSHLDFSKGELITLMPQEVSHDRLVPSCPVAYDSWIDEISQPGLPYALFVSYVETYLQKDSQHICVLVEQLLRAKPEMKLVDAEKKTYHFCREDVYFLLANKTLDTVNISKLLHAVYTGWCALTIMTVVPGNPQAMIENVELSWKDLQTLVEHTQAIAVGAYDGQGFIIWEKPSEE